MTVFSITKINFKSFLWPSMVSERFDEKDNDTYMKMIDLTRGVVFFEAKLNSMLIKIYLLSIFDIV